MLSTTPIPLSPGVAATLAAPTEAGRRGEADGDGVGEGDSEKVLSSFQPLALPPTSQPEAAARCPPSSMLPHMLNMNQREGERGGAGGHPDAAAPLLPGPARGE